MSEMNVGNVSGIYNAVSTGAAGSADVKSNESVKAENNAGEVAAVYEKGETSAKKATYSINKMSAEDRAALVQQ